jgi:hypothetical protein
MRGIIHMGARTMESPAPPLATGEARKLGSQENRPQ